MNKEFVRFIEGHSDLYRFYKIKRRMFPLESCLLHFPKKGQLIDLGCGNGLFAGLLSYYSPQLEVVGIDDDERKLARARSVFQDCDRLRFIKGNIVEIALPRGDHFSLVDVLYLIEYSAQEKILTTICQSIPANGVFILKEIDKRPLYKYLFNIFQETVSVKVLNRTLGGRFYFRGQDEMVALLKKIGFANIEVIPLHRGYLYPHILYRARL